MGRPHQGRTGDSQHEPDEVATPGRSGPAAPAESPEVSERWAAVVQAYQALREGRPQPDPGPAITLPDGAGPVTPPAGAPAGPPLPRRVREAGAVRPHRREGNAASWRVGAPGAEGPSANWLRVPPAEAASAKWDEVAPGMASPDANGSRVPATGEASAADRERQDPADPALRPAERSAAVQVPRNGHIGIPRRGWEKALIVTVGVAFVVAAGVGALLIARAGDDEGTTATTTTVAPAEPGIDVPVVLRSGGLDRTYVVHVPASYDGSRAVPVVLVLHGSGGSAEIANSISGMSVKSDAAGFLAVYPEGTGPIATFNAGLCCGYAGRTMMDDVSFMRDVVTDVSADYLVDPSRIYATGMSNGAMMVHRLGCEMSDVLAAIAPVAGALEVECAPAGPLSAIVFHGTADGIVPYAGGPAATVPRGMDPDYDPVSTAVNEWATADGCTGATDEQVSASVTRQVRTGCLAGYGVELYTVDGGGHAWPGGEVGWAGGDVPTTEVDATDVIWDFFAAHPKP
jgi:polyhydroxybutyrate depolymerase